MESYGFSECENEINQMEQYLIEKFDTVENGYNIKFGGISGGGRWPEEYKERVRESRIPTSKLANIHNRDGVLICERVAIEHWIRLNPGYDAPTLRRTADADWKLPTSGTNPHFHKDLCIRYITQDAPDFKNRNASNDNRTGIASPNAKLANIYHKTGYIVAESVVVEEWCRLNPAYFAEGLRATISADWSKPSAARNLHFYKDLFVTYPGQTRNTGSDHRIGANHHHTKLVDLYDTSGQLVAKSVSVTEWCKANPGYHQSALAATARSDRTQPSTVKNPHFHKGIRAEYI